MLRKIKILAVLLSSMMVFGCATQPASDGMHRVVIQVSTDDPRTQVIAVNNAVNVQKAYPPGTVEVEIVAYGPGLSLLTANSRQAKRIKDLALNDEFQFSACGNTMKKVKLKKGHEPKLIDGVKVVEAGVKRIIELQEQGYAYIRP
jgi:intracellular sulfur oxidation DsrE/DsrF family protein